METKTGIFWETKQRQANKLHECIYRASFKPEIVRYFVSQYTKPGDVVYDPFMGRGTTLIESNIMGRKVVGNDINPLAHAYAKPRLNFPTMYEIENFPFPQIDFDLIEEEKKKIKNPDLLVFFHPYTLREIETIRHCFLTDPCDHVSDWVKMVVLNRLTGHSPGYLSVFSIPQVTPSVERQKKINKQYGVVPERRVLRDAVIKKSKQLLSQIGDIRPVRKPCLLSRNAWDTPEIADASVDFVLTSPPFLDAVNYVADNWLRYWFLDVNRDLVKVTQTGNLSKWTDFIRKTLTELHRVLRPGGRIAFEVGEVKKGKVCLDEYVLEAADYTGLVPEERIINIPKHTKVSRCMNVKVEDGTHTNRIIVFRK